MKRGMIIVLAMLFLIPLATATIDINGPQINKYNIGDSISISGQIQESEPIRGFLKFSMACSKEDTEETHPMPMQPVALEANQQATFPGDIPLPDFVALSLMEGTCRIRADLTAGGVLLKWAESESFEITKELDGSFEIAEPKVQVGSDVAITGEITKLDGTAIDGWAAIYFRKDNEAFQAGAQSFNDGTLNFAYKTTAIPEGRYFVDIHARDAAGNEHIFKEAANFVLIKQLYVTGRVDDEQHLPGDTVTVSGTAKTVLQKPVESATVVLTLADKSYTTKIADGKFEGQFQLPHNIESGRHTLTIAVKDAEGNMGITKLRMLIIAIPSTINIRLNNDNFLPGDIIEITGTLYDQASAVMQEDIVLEIYDQEGTLATTKTASSAEKELFSFPEFAKPGEWTIKASYQDKLEQTETVTVNEQISLGVLLDNTLLKVKNLGNVEFDDEIQIEAIGEDETYIIDKKKTIHKNNTAVIDLASQLPTGLYSINIKTPDGQHEFSNVRIVDGKAWHSFNYAYILAVIACVGLLCYMAYSRMIGQGEKRRYGERRRYEPQKRYKLKNAEKKPVTEKKKFSIHDIGKDKANEMADYKARILKDIKQAEEAEARKQQKLNVARAMREKPKEEGGIFSMFD